jgi:hypothetical protein
LALLMQSAWALLLARLSGRDEVLLGWRHDGREDYPYFAGAVGVFEKTLPLNLSVNTEQSFAQWLPSLAAHLEEHRTWQEYWAPELQPAAARPAYGFAVQHLSPAQSVAALQWSAQGVETGRGDVFELLMQLQQTAEGDVRGLALEYAVQRYSAASMQVLLEQYRTLLGNLLGDADVPLGHVCCRSVLPRGRIPLPRRWH